MANFTGEIGKEEWKNENGYVGQQIDYSNHYWNYGYQETPAQNWNTNFTAYDYSQEYNYYSYQQNPTNYWGYSNWTPFPTQHFDFSMSTMFPASGQMVPIESETAVAPKKILERRPSMASMLSPLNIVPTRQSGNRKRLSKQDKEVLKDFIHPEDFSKKYSDAMLDIKKRLEKYGATGFQDYQVKNLFLAMRRDAANREKSRTPN